MRFGRVGQRAGGLDQRGNHALGLADELDVIPHVLSWRVDFMRDAGCQLTDRLHFLRLEQHGLGPA